MVLVIDYLEYYFTKVFIWLDSTVYIQYSKGGLAPQPLPIYYDIMIYGNFWPFRRSDSTFSLFDVEYFSTFSRSVFNLSTLGLIQRPVISTVSTFLRLVYWSSVILRSVICRLFVQSSVPESTAG